VKCWIFDFKQTRNLSTEFKKFSVSNFIQIRPVGAAMARADRRESRQTDEQDEGKNVSKTQLQLINCVKMHLKAIR
jgi:hypothetical protein